MSLVAALAAGPRAGRSGAAICELRRELLGAGDRQPAGEAAADVRGRAAIAHDASLEQRDRGSADVRGSGADAIGLVPGIENVPEGSGARVDGIADDRDLHDVGVREVEGDEPLRE